MHLSHNIGVPYILYLLAFVCEFIATFNVPLVRININLVALGLALFVLTFLI
jgi:hypothetical protein